MHSILSVMPSSGPYILPLGAKSSMLSLNKLASQIKEKELLEHYPYLADAIFQRKLEHHAGRVCAKWAIKALNINNTSNTISIGSKGEPIWPRGIIGSITHTQDFACAVVAPASAYIGIGIDSEKCVDEDGCADITNVCLGIKESQLLKNELLTKCQLATLMFSTKEAFYKAAYPYVKRFIDFDELEITDIDPLSGQIYMNSDVLDSRSSFHICGRYVIRDNYVHTSVVLYKK